MRITRRHIAIGAGAAVVSGTAAYLAGAKIASADAEHGHARNPKGHAGEAIPYLRGVNFAGNEFKAGHQWPVEAAVGYYITEKKMNVVRLNLSWELLQPVLSGPLDPAMIAGIEDQVRRVRAAGAWIILDIHNYGRRTISAKDYIIGETPMVAAGDFADLWRRIAGRWGNRSGVIFGLMNEPHDQDDATLVSVSNGAIAAIRAAGARNLILVNGNDWGASGWKPGRHNYAFMGPQIVDPLDNFAFDIHQYFDDASGTHDWCQPDKWQPAIEQFTKWARTNGKRAFCGEFAVGANATCAAQLKSFLDYLTANQDVWMGWAWWGGGGWWRQDYIFRLDPYAARFDPANPAPAASAHWDKPRVDRPQMAFLQPYLP